MTMPAWSYSSLSSFETCPRRHYLTKVAKTVTEPQSQALVWGNQVHKALELRVKNKTPLPGAMQQWEALADKLTKQKGQVFTETRMCLNKNLKPTTWFAKDAWVRGVVDVGVDNGKKALVLDYKGLPLDTEIPTPTGFVTMGDIREGDTVFSENGEQCRVIGKSQVKHLECYRILLDDTTTVTCDAEHLWKLTDGRVVPVTALRARDSIAVAAPLATPDANLAIDPYVLGVWLADGKHTSGEITKPDDFLWQEIQRRGYRISHDYSARAQDGKCRVHTVHGLRTRLRELGLLGNKHIPVAYLRAAYAQRLDLLRGLMDGDGSANPHRKQAIFSNTSKGLSDAVMELLCSLGQRPLQNTVTARGFGLVVTAYPISFRPNGINPFLLPRKADRILPTWGPGESARRRVVSVVEVESVPTQCIAVDSSDNTFLCTRKMVPTHNTGKPKPDSDQLKLFAAFMFHHKPHLQEVSTGFIWLGHGSKITKDKFTRDQLPDIWNEFMPRVQRLERAYIEDTWRPNPSGLCREWCPCKTCEFCGK